MLARSVGLVSIVKREWEAVGLQDWSGVESDKGLGLAVEGDGRSGAV